MRLLYVLPEFPPDFGGGIATVYGQLLPRLAELGHDITVLLASHTQVDRPKYEWRGVQVQPLQRAHLSHGEAEMQAWRNHAFLYHFLPTAWAAWNQALALGTFDLVETTDWALLFLPWLVQPRSQPVVVSLHGSCGQVDWHGNPRGRSGEGQLVRLLESAALPLADRLIANSNLNAEFWWQQCGVRAQLIPPIAVEPVLPAASQPRSNNGLVVARLQNWKGPEVLCMALRELPGQQIDWIGQDVPWQESTVSTSTHLRKLYPDVLDQQLHLLGRMTPDQVNARIQMASFLCIPSLWDVFNVTVIEAVAAGTPVICSDQAGAVMLIEHGHTGLLFKPDKPQDLAQAISFLQGCSAEDRQVMTAAASIYVSKVTNPGRIVSLYLATYEEAKDNFCGREASPWFCHLFRSGTLSCIQTAMPSKRISLPSLVARCLRWSNLK